MGVIFLFYKKLTVGFLIVSLLLVSCTPKKTIQKGDAYTVLEQILLQFNIENGAIYGKNEKADYLLTDALLERMFDHAGDLADFAYVESVAIWFSRRFNEKEIIVLKLYDLSHQRELLNLLSKRAAKKENAVAFANGIYVYLVCTDQNEVIMRDLP